MSELGDLLESAAAIAAQGDSITYPSGAAAKYVRRIMRDLLVSMGWCPAETAPRDGTHILVCSGPYSASWGFDQAPPMVVHYFSDPKEPGFYPSHGIVQDSYNDAPVKFTHWRRLGEPPSTGERTE